jgi:hypothetical protein
MPQHQRQVVALRLDHLAAQVRGRDRVHGQRRATAPEKEKKKNNVYTIQNQREIHKKK